ncbi:DUF882 domain-containing protein [Photobacterium phosphoreum]|jgi:uncharacterized protein YcbK (DUF882 family)|uniref:Murein endopeptidase K n=1 Tax=Photobacterium phosphoreum TaxID=659 RepID=A0AAW4ZIS3_PHOPO|nr:YcbK family protein [Photobacterium phosphoreum]KJF88697.1 hypothetical protein UB41_00340 [Photobacterium phosphoreum]MCD9461572.1 DUF882 domain-containing protein [Photobacterium phosphoreum]MCD9469681.1 DUF882 domain-containing protein [Photobacterium phosphoreum]MCD9473635.1 DUF882 domain-containing protein [Photobacterium phosphoreum]MCD9478614.1 DUF882 domain-containing protein [Photobacterium phosphoreum]
MSNLDISRRKFLTVSGLAVGACMLPNISLASPFQATTPRTMLLRNLHTGEELETKYFNGKTYVGKEVRRLDHLCRDFRQNEIARIDRRLYDAIAQIQSYLGHEGYAQLFSGYRSSKTNKMLAKRSGGVAKKSYHMKAQAIDFNLEGVPLAKIRKAALDLKIGGVGYYPNSQFVHIDTGPVRNWRG